MLLRRATGRHDGSQQPGQPSALRPHVASSHARVHKHSAARPLCCSARPRQEGNYAFARDYGRAVPRSFDVIHSDDTVTRNGG